MGYTVGKSSMSPDIEASHGIHDEVVADARNVLTAFASTLFPAHHLLASPRRTSIFGFTVLAIAKSTAIELPCLPCSFGLSIEFNRSTQRGEIQKNLPSSQGYNPWRTARHLTVGIVASIPSYEWFMFLHRRFNFASSIASLATKVVVQQAVFTSVFNTYFFTMQSLLSGASVEDTLVRLQLALPTSIANGVKVWTGVAIISFMYVPPQFRNPAAISAVTVVKANSNKPEILAGVGFAFQTPTDSSGLLGFRIRTA
ncbi:hypothetical protein N7501_001138 [Penicillium viridicatum]|nr:hypothetical protein N7501_001138 [Penicillium viridicatum]